MASSFDSPIKHMTGMIRKFITKAVIFLIIPVICLIGLSKLLATLVIDTNDMLYIGLDKQEALIHT
ncbi:MAG: hypothetical protein AAF901_08160, partial [Bacteroidota bacterium]